MPLFFFSKYDYAEMHVSRSIKFHDTEIKLKLNEILFYGIIKII